MTKEAPRSPWWLAVVPAVAGLVGGTVSGFTTAYVQLSTKREEYSIERAKQFRELMTELKEKDTARLAVLNLWQLYPDERDRRIITAAAFAVDQPDLVEIIRGIDQELGPISEMLHARAMSQDDAVRDPALLTLINLDEVRAARVLIHRVREEMETKGDRITSATGGIDPVLQLARLASTNDTVHKMLMNESDTSRQMLLDYIIYRAQRDGDFIERLTEAYKSRSDLRLASDYLRRAEFNSDDVSQVVEAVAEFITTSMSDPEVNVFHVVDAVSALRNREFQPVLRGDQVMPLALELEAVIADPKFNDTLRARALSLLHIISPRMTLEVLGEVVVANSAEDELKETMAELLKRRLIAQVERDNSGYTGPDCSKPLANCVEQVALWQSWKSAMGENQ